MDSALIFQLLKKFLADSNNFIWHFQRLCLRHFLQERGRADAGAPSVAVLLLAEKNYLVEKSEFSLSITEKKESHRLGRRMLCSRFSPGRWPVGCQSPSACGVIGGQ